jgi:hypothetical protein
MNNQEDRPSERETIPPPMPDYPKSVLDPEGRKATVKIKKVWFQSSDKK